MGRFVVPLLLGGLVLAGCGAVTPPGYYQSAEYRACRGKNWVGAECLPSYLAPEDVAAFVADRPARLKPLYARLFVEGERNAVLNLNRLGLAAMELGHVSDAAWAFDRSLDLIEAIYADDENARKARSLFVGERIKDFRGEPYERAMAYYYRGLLYLAAGDYENARAVFRAGEFQDSISEADENFSADFAVLNYLAGWASRCLALAGRGPDLAARAADEFALARTHNARLAPPAPGADWLVVVETGNGPRKVGSGRHGEILRFEPGQDSHPVPMLPIHVRGSGGGGKAGAIPAATDLFFQASTRGGRKIDGILEGKALFRDVTGTVGSVVTHAGAAALLYGDENGETSDAQLVVGSAAVLTGLLLTSVSAATTPDADTRVWDTLPAAIYVGALPDPPAPPDRHKPLLSTQGSVCKLAWWRETPAHTRIENWSAVLSPMELDAYAEKLVQEDQAFRTFLLNG